MYIEDIGPERITIRRYPYYPDDRQTLDRDVAEDLIAEGNETVRNKKTYNGEPSPRRKWIHRDTDLKEIKRRRITFKIKEDAAQKMDYPPADIERKYRSEYGLETNMGVGDLTFETTVTADKVSEIRELPEIRVLESKKLDR